VGNSGRVRSTNARQAGSKWADSPDGIQAKTGSGTSTKNMLVKSFGTDKILRASSRFSQRAYITDHLGRPHLLNHGHQNNAQRSLRLLCHAIGIFRMRHVESLSGPNIVSISSRMICPWDDWEKHTRFRVPVVLGESTHECLAKSAAIKSKSAATRLLGQFARSSS